MNAVREKSKKSAGMNLRFFNMYLLNFQMPGKIKSCDERESSINLLKPGGCFMYQQQGHLIGHDNRTERDKYIME
jgi:hypothetical protein